MRLSVYNEAMCGRFNSHLPKMLGWAEMLNNWPEISANYNVAPSSSIAAFCPSDEGAYGGQIMRWGLVPSWSKTFDSKYATFNARLETLDEKASFRSAWKHKRRCLIPMAGYYEWSAINGNPQKQPFYVSDPNIGGLVAAGLFEDWRSNGEPNAISRSCTMITRPADPDLARIHGRMPVLLTPETAQQWMNTERFEGDDVESDSNIQRSLAESKQLLNDCEKPYIVYWPVDRAVGNVRNNHAGLCAAIDLAD